MTVFLFCVMLFPVKIWYIIGEHEYINIAEKNYIRSSELGLQFGF